MQMFKAILAALTLYLIFLIQQLPANQALSWVSLPANVQISGVSGTVWDGKTQLAVINGMPVRDVRWQLSALPLLWGEASLRIQAGNARDSQQLTFNGELALSASSVSATDLTLYVPASMALANVPLPVPVDANGRFKVAIEQAQWQGKCVALSGQGDWLNAAVAGTQGLISLDSFHARLSCAGDDLQVRIDPDNIFNLDATAAVTPQGKYQIQGKFKPAARLPEEVHQAARFFGRTDADGFYTLNWR